jgi:hypothetical protein
MLWVVAWGVNIRCLVTVIEIFLSLCKHSNLFYQTLHTTLGMGMDLIQHLLWHQIWLICFQPRPEPNVLSLNLSFWGSLTSAFVDCDVKMSQQRQMVLSNYPLCLEILSACFVMAVTWLLMRFGLDATPKIHFGHDISTVKELLQSTLHLY